MIIFGWRNRQKTVDAGEFQCPACRTHGFYRLQAVRTWFTLYFIPVIPLQSQGQFVQCQTCGGTFYPEILAHTMVGPAESVVINPSAELRDGVSAEAIYQKLIAHGMGETEAWSAVERALGDQRKTCGTCKSTYHASIATCPTCQVVI